MEQNSKYILKSTTIDNNVVPCFDFVHTPLPDPSSLQENQLIVQTKFISVDAYNKILITPGTKFYRTVSVGDTMKGLVVGEVVASKSTKFSPGDMVTGELYWSSYIVCLENQVRKIPKEYPHPHHFVTVLGISGLTALFGLKEVLLPKEGETLVVSAAAGAVGELVVQIGKIFGLKVVGIAGSDEKCKYVQDIGAYHCINYKKSNVLESLKEHCPNGVDMYFDNVGGEILESVLEVINKNGRIACCGMISQYGNANQYGVKNLFILVAKTVKMQGFLLFDYYPKFEEAIKEIMGYLQKGMIKMSEDFNEGLETAPKVLEKLLKGENKGKSLIRIKEGKAKIYQ